VGDQPWGAVHAHITRSKPRQATNTRVMAGQLKTPRSPQCATARSLSPHHKHIVPVARDLEMLAGEDTSTTIDSVDGDIAIMRIQLLTGVSRLLLSPNSERPPAALRTIAFLLPPPPVARSRWRRRSSGATSASPDGPFLPAAMRRPSAVTTRRLSADGVALRAPCALSFGLP
jgi:hypothetical protein